MNVPPGTFTPSVRSQLSLLSPSQYMFLSPWFLKQCVLALTTADTGDETVREDFCLLLAWDPLGGVF